LFEKKADLRAGVTEEGLKDMEKVREKTREKILRLFRENPLITTSEIAEKIGVTLKGVVKSGDTILIYSGASQKPDGKRRNK